MWLKWIWVIMIPIMSFSNSLDILSMHYNFLVSEGFQGTHVDALNPFVSKLMPLTPRVGLWTFSAILALCVAWRHQGAAAIRLHIIQRLRFQLLDGLALQFGSKKWTFYSAQVANNQPVEASQAVSPFKSRPCSFPLPFWRMTACPSANISTNDRTAWYY